MFLHLCLIDALPPKGQIILTWFSSWEFVLGVGPGDWECFRLEVVTGLQLRRGAGWVGH